MSYTKLLLTKLYNNTTCLIHTVAKKLFLPLFCDPLQSSRWQHCTKHAGTQKKKQQYSLKNKVLVKDANRFNFLQKLWHICKQFVKFRSFILRKFCSIKTRFAKTDVEELKCPATQIPTMVNNLICNISFGAGC